MMTRTHAPTGLAAWMTMTMVFHLHIHPAVVAAGGLLAWYAAMTPDIDNPRSHPGHQVDQLVPGLSAWLQQHIGHRGITHWGITAVGVGTVFGLLLGALSTPLWWLGLAIGVGWLAHILGDCLTWSGAPLLAPFSTRLVRPPYGWRFETNGDFERLIVIWLVRAWAIVATIAFAYTVFTG